MQANDPTPAPASETRYYGSYADGCYWSKRDGRMWFHTFGQPDGEFEDEPVESFPDGSHPEITPAQVAAIRAAWKEGQ